MLAIVNLIQTIFDIQGTRFPNFKFIDVFQQRIILIHGLGLFYIRAFWSKAYRHVLLLA